MRSLLDGDGFEERLGATISVTRQLESGTLFRVRLVHDEVDELESIFSFVEGSRDQLRFSVQRALSRGSIVVDVGYEDNDRLGGGVSPSRARASLRYRRQIRGPWTMELSSILRESDYDESATPREETLEEISLSAQRELPSRWRLNAQIRYADNDSSDAAFTYTRTRVSIGLSKLF